MLLNEVKIEDLINRVREIAERSPSYVYPVPPRGCSYTHFKDGDPTWPCIFGQAFLELGVEESELQVYNDGVAKSITAILRFQGIKRTKQQELWCGSVQGDQDTGRMWGRAIENADQDYKV